MTTHVCLYSTHNASHKLKAYVCMYVCTCLVAEGEELADEEHVEGRVEGPLQLLHLLVVDLHLDRVLRAFSSCGRSMGGGGVSTHKSARKEKDGTGW